MVKKIVLVLAFVTITVLAAYFALDSWYKDYGPNYARLEGIWTCDRIVRPGERGMDFEPCNVQEDGSLIRYDFDWSADGGLVILANNSNEIGSGRYYFIPPPGPSRHNTMIELEMDSPTSLSNKISLGDGIYMLHMRNINELTIYYVIDGHRHPYGDNYIILRRQSDKFDLSFIASELLR